jgi:hypothetical protein
MNNMTKTEVLETINNLIVTNGQKGITAESLNLILTEIVNLIDTEPKNPSSETLIIKFAGSIDGSVEIEYTPEILANNAEVYAKVKDCVNNNLPIPMIGVDFSCLANLEAESAGIEFTGAYILYSIMTAFIEQEIEGIKGLMLYCVFGQIIVSEDGTISILE